MKDDEQETQGDEIKKANDVGSSEPNDMQAVVGSSDLTPAPAPSPSQTSIPGLFPTVPVLEKRTYSSAMSYVGITRRTTAWVRKAGSRSPVAAGVATLAAVLFLLVMYSFLLVWYTIVLYGPLIFFTLPFRLIRRSQRKNHHLQQTQLATMQTMLVQQQQAMLKNQPPSDPSRS